MRYRSQREEGKGMGNFGIAFNAVAPLLLFMLAGLFARHQLHLGDRAVSELNRLLFGVFLPANMFASVYFTQASQLITPSFILYGVLSLLAVYCLGYFLVVRFVKSNRKRGAMIQAIYRSNFILLGVPLIENIYGADAVPVPMMLAAFVVPIYNVLAIFTLERFRSDTPDIRPGHILAGVLHNPMVIGAILGLCCKLLPFDLPALVEKCIHQLASVTTPFALVVLGASFTLQGAYSELKEVTISVVARLVLAPLLVVGAGLALGFRGIELASLLAMSGTPVAVASFAMAQQMGSDGELAGDTVIFSCAFSFITLFLWIYGLQALGAL
jgi:predicted permease